MLGTLKRAVTRRDGFQECRHCGTTVDWLASDCPACGSQELAHYEL